MFYITIHRKNTKDKNQTEQRVCYVGIPQHFMQNDSYYQIYENNKPLLGMSFTDEKMARNRLRGLVEELRVASNGWYRVETRLPSYMPVRKILGVKKIYGDGSSINMTYVIKKITMQPVNSDMH